MAGTAPNNDVLNWIRIARLVPQALLDGVAGIIRGGLRGETTIEALSLKNDKLLDEGSLYICRSPTVGTGVTGQILQFYDDTKPTLIVTNNNPPGGRNVFLDTIRLQLVAVGTAATSLQWCTTIDNISRYSSGGSGGAGTAATGFLGGPYSPHSVIGASSSALVYFGALVAIARSVQWRQLESGLLRTAIPVASDQYIWTFGGHENMQDGVLVSGAAIAQRSIPHVGVEIAPGHSFLLYLWEPACTAAPTFEVHIAYHER
jgi:hypothetical protein